MNSTDKETLQKFTKELSTLHYALTFGAFMVSVFIYFFAIEDGHFYFSNTDDYFLYICPLLAIAGVFGGMYIYRNKIEEINDIQGLDEKLAAYRVGTVSKLSLIEGPAMICIVAAMLTQNLLYLVIALVLVGYMYAQKVSEEKIVEELRI